MKRPLRSGWALFWALALAPLVAGIVGGAAGVQAVIGFGQLSIEGLKGAFILLLTAIFAVYILTLPAFVFVWAAFHKSTTRGRLTGALIGAALGAIAGPLLIAATFAPLNSVVALVGALAGLPAGAAAGLFISLVGYGPRPASPPPPPG